MIEFAYTTVPTKLKDLMDKVRNTGIPVKATRDWIKSVGFTSSNDPSLLTVLKQIGFCDESGTPTDHWRQYRGQSHKTVLASAIKTGYQTLFDIYPNAWSRSDDDLDSFFATKSSAGKQAIDKTVNTFKALVALADFGTNEADVSSGTTTTSQPVDKDTSAHAHPPNVKSNGSSTSLHINIQIHTASDATAEQIEQIFLSMSTHLYKNQ